MQNILKKYAKKTIVFCMPGNKFSPEFIKNFIELNKALVKEGINCFISNSYSPEIHQLRSLVGGGDRFRGLYQTPFIANDLNYDYLMWIDSDIIFTIEDFINLLEMDKPLCTGWYYQGNGLPAAGFFKKTPHKSEKETLPFDVYDKNHLYSFKNDEELPNKVEPYPIDWCGMGWMLMKRGVLEQIKYPWFAPKIVRYDHPEAFEVMSEDLSFAMSLEDAGIRIWMNPAIKVGHEKPKIY